ncbi:hypothetical protein PQX77_004238 [Marasmius sp. AFHP31]|nr:hypothetical protein PQX77_004238 [Marasmius sp. AFHP31]
MLVSFAHEFIAAVALSLVNHMFFHHYEPTRSTIGSAVALLAIQPCLLSVGIGLSGTSSLSIHLLLRISASFFVALPSSIVLYRISPFHPLANVPGPLAAKVSKLWGLWVCWTGRYHVVMKRLHDKYGPVIRTGPNEISTIEISAVAGVLGVSGLPKGQWYSVRQDLRAPKSILSLSGGEHAKRRKLWNRGLSWQALRDHESTLWQRVRELLRGIADTAKGKEGNTIDLDLWLKYFTFDFMGDMAFGQGSHMVRDGGDTTGLLKELVRFSKIRALLSHVPWAFEWAHILPFTSHQILGVRDYGINCVRSRVQRGPAIRDLWYYLNDEAGLEKQKPLTPDVLADGMVAVIAGSDTSSAVMSILVWCLLAHPDCYRRVEEEIDEAFCDSLGEEIQYPELQAKLVYLEACM